MLRVKQANSAATLVAQLFAADDSYPCHEYLLPKSPYSGGVYWVNLEFLCLLVIYIFSQPKGEESESERH
jgi:hypothetical protein